MMSSGFSLVDLLFELVELKQEVGTVLMDELELVGWLQFLVELEMRVRQLSLGQQ